MAFELNQRVQIVETGQMGIVTSIADYVDVLTDDGVSAHFQLDGSRCDQCEMHTGTLAAVTPFRVGQRVRYRYSRSNPIGTITEIRNHIRVTLDDQEGYEGGFHTRSFDLQGRGGRTAEHDDATYDSHITAVPEVIESPFEIGQRVHYCMPSGAFAIGTVSKLDDMWLYVKLDDDQTHVRYPGYERIFRHDGAGTGNVSGIPYPIRATELGAQLINAPPEWQPTPGREYPEKPRIGYGVFDGYYGRPLQKDNEGAHGTTPRVGWGVVNWGGDHNGFSQGIFETEEEAKTGEYLRNALMQWKSDCLDVDIAAIENPFEFLKGAEVYSAWLHADSFGMEIYFPGEARARHRFDFLYPRACCTAGLMLMDEVNKFFRNNAGVMRVVDVDGTKFTVTGVSETIEFHVLPKLIEDFKPTLGALSLMAKESALRNLAMQSEERDSPLPLAA
jgi:hypothetical protein